MQKILQRGVCDPWHSDPVFSLLNRNLSENWALEYTGADLIKEEFLSEMSIPPGLIALVDTDTRAFNNHGRHVHNIMSGSSHFSILPETQTLNRYELLGGQGKVDSDFELDARKLGQRGHQPKYLNLSIKLDGHWPISLAHMIRSSNDDQRFIFAAGNEARRIDQDLSELASGNNKVLIVGSLTPFGSPTITSNFGDLVISAPSDHHLVAKDKSKIHIFGETSGAAPQVTAALAAFDLIADYHPTPEEIRRLLANSVTPFPFSHGDQYGKGILNTYRLTAIAKRIKDKCRGNTYCSKAMIASDDIYHFTHNKDLEHKLATSFPYCVQTASRLTKLKRVAFDCRDLRNTFKALRQRALLNPEDKNLWRILACVHAAHGLHANAIFYAKLAHDSAQIVQSQAALVAQFQKQNPTESKNSLVQRKSEIFHDDLFNQNPSLKNLTGWFTPTIQISRRLIQRLDKDINETLTQIESLSENQQLGLLSQLGYKEETNAWMRSRPTPPWLIALFKSRTVSERTAAAAFELITSWKEPAEKIHFIQAGLDNPSPEVRKSAALSVARALAREPYAKNKISQKLQRRWHELLQIIIAREDPTMVEVALSGLQASHIAHAQILESLSQHHSPSLRAAANKQICKWLPEKCK